MTIMTLGRRSDSSKTCCLEICFRFSGKIVGKRAKRDDYEPVLRYVYYRTLFFVAPSLLQGERPPGRDYITTSSITQ